MRQTAVLTLEYPPFKGGVARFAASVYHSLEKDSRHLIVPTSLTDVEDTSAHLTFNSRYLWPHWLALFFSLRSYIKKNKIEQLIVFHVLPIGTVAYFCSLFLPIRYTISIHGLDFVNAQKGFIKRLLLKRILAKSENIIAISTYVKKLLIDFGISEYKIALVSPLPFITPSTITPKPREDISEAFVNRSFVSVGRLVERKNFKTILEVAKQAKSRHIPFYCILVGDGPEKKNLLTFIRAYDLSDRIRLITQCTDNQLAWLYKHCLATIFIPTSHDADVEGYGIVCAESSSFGKPIIASTEGGVPDAVYNNVTGLLVHPTDVNGILHLIHVLSSMPALRKYLGSNGKRMFRQNKIQPLFLEAIRLLSGQMPKPSVSAIIPMYNASATISDTIESLLHQTYKLKEIIIVDDGSTDDSLRIAKRYSDFCIILSQKNLGAPSARNYGASKATGEFLIFVDADITAKPFMLETMFKALYFSPQASWAYSSFTFGWKEFYAFPFSHEKLKQHNYIHTSSLIRKKAFCGFDQNLKRHQDWDLWLTLAEKGYFGINIQKNLYTIHVQKKRISSWVPSFVYKIPGSKKISSRVRTYETSADIIRHKHHLV